ncbi:hypothetical protein BGX20_007921 [Mortierella sp. AD010]|nr:hypothetical protein BGX20_007921 [Mortierella sp. AD010]
MREGYVRQWRRGLVKRASALVKFVRKDGVELAAQRRNIKNRPSDQGAQLEDDISRSSTPASPQAIFQQLGYDTSDLSIVLGTAERLLPTITEFVRVHLGVE